MTIPATGISFIDINRELALSNTNSTSINDGGPRALAGNGAASGTQISFSDLASKTGRKVLVIDYANSSNYTSNFLPWQGYKDYQYDGYKHLKITYDKTMYGGVVKISQHVIPGNTASVIGACNEVDEIGRRLWSSHMMISALGSGGYNIVPSNTYRVSQPDSFLFQTYTTELNTPFTYRINLDKPFTANPYTYNSLANYTMRYPVGCVPPTYSSTDVVVTRIFQQSNSVYTVDFHNGHIVEKYHANSYPSSAIYFGQKSCSTSNPPLYTGGSYWYTYNANSYIAIGAYPYSNWSVPNQLGNNAAGTTTLAAYNFNTSVFGQYTGGGYQLSFLDTSMNHSNTVVWSRGYQESNVTAAGIDQYGIKYMRYLANNALFVALFPNQTVPNTNFNYFVKSIWDNNGVRLSTTGFGTLSKNTTPFSNSSYISSDYGGSTSASKFVHVDDETGDFYIGGYFGTLTSQANSVYQLTSGEFVDNSSGSGVQFLQKVYANNVVAWARQYYASVPWMPAFTIGKTTIHSDAKFQWSYMSTMNPILGFSSDSIYILAYHGESNSYVKGTTTNLTSADGSAPLYGNAQQHSVTQSIVALSSSNGQPLWARDINHDYFKMEGYSVLGPSYFSSTYDRSMFTNPNSYTVNNAGNIKVFPHPYANNLLMVVCASNMEGSLVTGDIDNKALSPQITSSRKGNIYSNNLSITNQLIIVKKSDGSLVSTGVHPGHFTSFVAPSANSIFKIPATNVYGAPGTGNTYLTWLDHTDVFHIYRLDAVDTLRFPYFNKWRSGLRIISDPCGVSAVNTSMTYWTSVNTAYSPYYGVVNSSISVTTSTFTVSTNSNTSVVV